ncbi:MAG: hypothetical protein QXO69_00175 [archaeon]
MKGFMETDMVVSVAIFLVFVIIMSITLSGQLAVYKERSEKEMREAKARDTLNMMIRSPGYPERWDLNASSITSFGLAYDSFFSRPALLDFRKINATSQLAYQKLKELNDAEDISILIEDKDLNVSYSFGQQSQRKKISSVQMPIAIRYAYGNVSKGKITVTEWF